MSRAVQRRRSDAFVRRLALACAVLVLAITSLSAFIRLSKAGLSCADWPACYGQGLRELQQGRPAQAGEGVATAAARLAHRIVASVALLLVITLVVVSLSARPLRLGEAGLALALLALALFLAVLGRWSADARVPAVAMGNLLGGFAMLALCWRLARARAAAVPGRLRGWAALGALLVAAQVALGGLLSASFAATSCSDLPDCIASASDLSWRVLDPWREPLLGAAPAAAANPDGALAQAVHRLAAIGVASLLLPLAAALWRSGLRRAGASIVALLAGALALGLALAGGPSLAAALAHNLVAALLLATLFDLAAAGPRPGQHRAEPRSAEAESTPEPSGAV